MNIKEISKYADSPTYTSQQTILKFKKGEILVGFFGDNMPNNKLRSKNKWNFVLFQPKDGKKEIIIKGDNIENIDITFI